MLIERLKKYNDKNSIIEYIDPYSEIGIYQYRYDDMKMITSWLDHIANIITILIDEEDIAITKNLGILTSIQIMIYYTKYNKVDYKNPLDLMVSCYILVFLLYNEDSYIGSKRIINQLAIKILPIKLSYSKVNKYIKNLLEFFNYDFFSMPLTINYLIWISENDEEGYDNIMDKIDTNIYYILNNSILLEKNPYDLTMYILEKIEKYNI
jgi:hypothetical protein